MRSFQGHYPQHVAHRPNVAEGSVIDYPAVRYTACLICVIARSVALALVWHHASTTTLTLAHGFTKHDSGVEDASLDKRLATALRLFQISSSAEGEAELKDLADTYPSDPRASLYLGLWSQESGEAEAALTHYVAALRADASHADAMNNIGAVLTTLSSADRVRLVEDLDLVQLFSGAEAEPLQGVAGPHSGAGIAAADAVVEAIYRATLAVDSSHRWGLNNLGLHLHEQGRNSEAVLIFERAVDLYPDDIEIHFNLGVALERLGMAQKAASSFGTALQLDAKHVGAALNLAALHHRYGETSTAIEHYRRSVNIIDRDDLETTVMLRNNLGTALFQTGEHTLAKEEHQAVLALLDGAAKQWLGGAGGVDVDDLFIDTLVNLHRARKASCDWMDWESRLSELFQQVDTSQLGRERSPALLPFDCLLIPYPVTPDWRRRIAEAYSGTHTGQALRTLSTFGDGAENHPCQQALCMHGVGATSERPDPGAETSGNRGSGESWERGGERQLKVGFVGHDFNEHPTAHMMEGVFLWHERFENAWRLDEKNVGSSTAERTLLDRRTSGGERVVSPKSATCCRYTAYSYGGDHADPVHVGNGSARLSRARESIRSHVSAFVDIFASGHRESAARIRQDRVDILVDLQGHTLRGRGEILAMRPARLQVNYLVFPGTSGAPYIDYLLADRHMAAPSCTYMPANTQVTPPEHARHYSEKLVLLPRTYQANFYENLMPLAALATTRADDGRVALRRSHGLPEDLARVVFANFNKLDKLDPETFTLWMQILRRVPGSVLWLMDASAAATERVSIRNRLVEEAKSQGIDASRIVWADRLPKGDHLLRHAAADLFLDTLVYGAHSTASDALAGGLPVLTLAGDSFASRVGVSLVRNVDPAQRALLVYGQREYEDVSVAAVSTSSGRRLLQRLRASLTEGGAQRRGAGSSESGQGIGGRTVLRETDQVMPLFDTETITRELNLAFTTMSDLYDVSRHRARANGDDRRGDLPHIVLTQKRVCARAEKEGQYT